MPSELLPAKKAEHAFIELFADILRRGSALRVRVTGRSMSPFLSGGEVLTIRKVPSSSLGTGDLVLFRDRHDSLVLHRILRKKILDDNTSVFLTKGDALSTYDEPVPEHNILGKVCSLEYSGSSLKMAGIDTGSFLWEKINYARGMIHRLKPTRYYSALLRVKREILKLCGALQRIHGSPRASLPAAGRAITLCAGGQNSTASTEAKRKNI